MTGRDAVRSLEIGQRSRHPEHAVVSSARQAEAVVNIGFRPTFEESQYWVQAYLFDFAGDLYDRTLTLDFLVRIRAEMKFPGVEALTVQVRADMAEARRLLRAQPAG